MVGTSIYDNIVDVEKPSKLTIDPIVDIVNVKYKWSDKT